MPPHASSAIWFWICHWGFDTINKKTKKLENLIYSLALRISETIFSLLHNLKIEIWFIKLFTSARNLFIYFISSVLRFGSEWVASLKVSRVSTIKLEFRRKVCHNLTTAAEGCWIIASHTCKSREKEGREPADKRDFYLSSAPGSLHSSFYVCTTRWYIRDIYFMIISVAKKGQTNYSYLSDNWARGINYIFAMLSAFWAVKKSIKIWCQSNFLKSHSTPHSEPPQNVTWVSEHLGQQQIFEKKRRKGMRKLSRKSWWMF